MTDLRKAAEMALETLCVGANDAVPNDIDKRFEQAIQALRQALAAPEQRMSVEGSGKLTTKPYPDSYESEQKFRQTLLPVKTYAGGKPNYCTPLQSDRIRIDPVTGDVGIGTVDAVNMSQESVDETAKSEHEPVYAFRRKGLDDFCTCDKRRYDELAGKPNLFEVAIFYTAPPKRDSSSWVGLSDADKEELLANLYESVEGLITAIEAKLKDKNGW